MFVDELTITAKAGDGGDGVVRWHRVKFKPMGGPAGGDGGFGGDVYLRAVRDLNRLAKYTGAKEFAAKDGEDGRNKSQHGKGSLDIYIDVPVGSIVTDVERERVYELFEEGQEELILKGGQGGRGNEHFKSSTNQAPETAQAGKPGEFGTFHIELSLVVDAGLIGYPSAGKSTLLNLFTNATSAVGAYHFTTLEPHLGSLFGYTLADIPGLIEGAADGKGLGHKFLRHVTRTKMILHLVSLEHEDPISMYESIRGELGKYQNDLLDKEEWIILTKKDLVNKEDIEPIQQKFDKYKKRVFITAENDAESIKKLQDELVAHLRSR